VINRRRNLTPTTLDGFAIALGINAEEAGFFRSLVALDQAETEAEKNEAWEQVASSRRFRNARRIEGEVFRYLSNWYFPAVRELALRHDFQADPDWVASQLLPRVTPAQARQALQTLTELGMLVQDETGTHPAEVSVATAFEVAGLAAHNYHRQMLERASEAIELADPDERHLSAITVAIPVDLVPRLKSELDTVMERLLHLCDEQAHAAERVYQLNVQLIPLSRAPDSET
jgi:uncharacterized protein (TIGR02147 family)